MTQCIIATKDKKTGDLSLSAKPKIHSSFSDAVDEARRLANRLPHKKMVILSVAKVISVNDVVIEDTI